MAQGQLPALSSGDCAPPAEKGMSPLSGLAGPQKLEAAKVLLEDLMAPCVPAKETYAYSTYSLTGWMRGPPREDPVAASGVVGLRNLGNTCFMNSILQCLAASEPLTNFFCSDDMLAQLNAENPLGSGGRLALAWAALSRLIRSPTSTTLTPVLIKEFVTEKAPQFSGYQQHDSKEFAEFLLSGLNEDLLRVPYPKKAYEDPVDGSATVPEEEVARETWARYKARDDGIVTDVFAGMHHSKLQCSVCHTSSVKCDPWTSLLLSLPEHEQVELTSMPGGATSEPLCNVKLQFSKHAAAPAAAAGGAAAAEEEEEEEEEPVNNYNNYYGANYYSYGKKAAAVKKPSITVAEAVAWYSAAARDTSLPTVLSPSLSSAALAAPEATAAASGYLALALDTEELLFHRVMGAREKAMDQKRRGKLATKCVIYPVPVGGSFIPCALRLRLAGDDAQFALLPGKTLHGSVRVYESAMLHVTPTTTCADIWQQIFSHMTRFMSPAFAAAHSAEAPPFTLHVLAPLQIAEGGRAGAAGDALQEAAAKRYEPVPHSAALFTDTYTSASLLLQIERPTKADMPDFPTYASPLKYGGKQAWSACTTHPAAANPVPDVSLDSLLELNQQMETLKGMEEVYCRQCKEHRTFTKVMRLWQLPPIIPITLKRFKVVENNWGQSTLEKSNDPVVYPVLGLDMSPYLRGPQLQAPPAVAFSPDRPPVPTLPPIYDLIAVSNHGGGMGGGHYTAYIQDFKTGQWHHMDGESRRQRAAGRQRAQRLPRSPAALSRTAPNTHAHTRHPPPPFAPPQTQAPALASLRT